MKKVIKLLIGLGLLTFVNFSALQLFSQEIIISQNQFKSKLYNLNYYIKTAIDDKSKLLYVYSGDTLITINLSKFSELERFKLKLPDLQEVSHEVLFPKFLKGELYFVHNQGGYLFRLNNDSLVRVDNSFNHKMQCDASILVRDDTLYKFGGYGFWSNRNFFTYFNYSTKEWDVVQPFNQEVPPGVSFADTYIDKNKIYVFNGLYQDEWDYQKSKELDQIWVFDFSSGIWKYLGKRKISASNYKMKISGENYFIMMDKTSLFKLDFPKNRTYIYRSSSLSSSIVANSIYYSGYMYLFTANSSSDSPIILQKVKEDMLLQELKDVKRIYISPNRIYYLLLIIILIPFLGLIFWINYKRNKNNKRIILKDGEIKYQKLVKKIDDTSYKILKALLDKNELDTNGLLELIDNKDLHYSHRTRVLHQLITELNLKLTLLTGINEDFILVKKSELDKRIKSYYLNKSMF